MLAGNQPTVGYSFQSESIVAGQISGFRTGDVKVSNNVATKSLSGVYSNLPGWILMDNSTIGDSGSGSGATHMGKYLYPLYDYLWTNVGEDWAPVFDSDGLPDTYGASSAEDFLAGKRLSLTRAAGRVLAGTNPDENVLLVQFTVPSFGNNRLTILPDASSFFAGTRVRVDAYPGGTLPDPLVDNVTYYAIPFSATQIKLATSYANALAGTEIALIDGGSGDFNIRILSDEKVLGQYEGEYLHGQTEDELVSHLHTYTAPNALTTIDNGADASVSSGPVSQDTGNTGGNTPFNITQPTVYMNVFIKI
jgi:hypothetical protein